MDKLDLNDNDIQCLEFTNRELIKNFYEHHIDFWRRDIHRFDEYMEGITTEIIEKICIFTWNITSTNVDFKIDIYLNDGTKRDIHCNYAVMVKWLKNNSLIE